MIARLPREFTQIFHHSDIRQTAISRSLCKRIHHLKRKKGKKRYCLSFFVSTLEYVRRIVVGRLVVMTESSLKLRILVVLLGLIASDQNSRATHVNEFNPT